MPNTTKVVEIDQVREKLIELLETVVSPNELLCDGEVRVPMSRVADHLIANGVTVQGWISVKDRLPTPYMQVLTLKQPLGGQQPFMTVDYITIGYGETKIWVGDIGTWKNEVTHWMELPQPPKGE